MTGLTGPPCPPWRDIVARGYPASQPGPPWRDRSWTMPPEEKPGLGQGLGQGCDFAWSTLSLLKYLRNKDVAIKPCNIGLGQG